jgi:hypothetical protein
MTRKIEATSFRLNSIQAVYRKILNREDESVEVDRLTTIDGSAFPIVDKEVYLSGRRIFLEIKMGRKSLESEAFLSVFSNDGNTRDKTHGILFL